MKNKKYSMSPKIIIFISFILLSIMLAAEEKNVKIESKQKTLTIEKKKGKAVVGVASEELIQNICKKQKEFSPVAFLLSGVLVVSLASALALMLVFLRARILLSRDSIFRKFEKHINPLRKELMMKNHEITILKDNINKSAESGKSEQIESLKSDLEQKENIIADLMKEISTIKESQEGPSQKDIEIEKLKDEMEVLSQEKIEFLSMIESLQKQLGSQDNDDIQPDTQNIEENLNENSKLTQDDLDALLGNGNNDAPEESKPEESSSNFNEILSQEDMDKLLSGGLEETDAADDKSQAEDPPEPDPKSSDQSAESDDNNNSSPANLSQDDLDSLFDTLQKK